MGTKFSCGQGKNYESDRSWHEVRYTENLCKVLAEQLTKHPQTASYLSLKAVEDQSDSDINVAKTIIARKQAQLNNLSHNDIDSKGIVRVIHYKKETRDGKEIHMPVEITVDLNVIKGEIENAEIDLKEAVAEKKVWRDLLSGKSSIFERKTPLHDITKKSDLKPDVIKYIDEHTYQIGNLLTETKTLEKGTPEYQENEERRKQLARERGAARRILVRYFSENHQFTQDKAPETEQDIQVDILSTVDQIDAERDIYIKNLETAEQKKKQAVELEKTHYGYVEGEGRAPLIVIEYEKTIANIRLKIIQKEKDADLLYRVYKENGKNPMLSKAGVRGIIAKMIQERDAKIAAIDEELEKVEKKSERWVQLKQERAKVYRVVPDDTVARVLELFN